MARHKLLQVALLILSVLVVVALGVTSISRTAATGDTPPSARVAVDQTEKDFGIVRQEQAMLTHTFTFTNTGHTSAPLKIVHIGCNCVGVECPDSVPPGASVPVKVNLEIGKREGAFATRVMLSTTDAETPSIELLLKFWAHPNVHVEPPSLTFSGVKRGDILEQELSVTTQSEIGKPLAPPPIEVSDDAVTCVHLGTRQAGALIGDDPAIGRAIHRYRIRLDTSRLPSGERVRLRDVICIQPAESRPDKSKVCVPIDVAFRHHGKLFGQTSVTIQESRSAHVRLWTRDGSSFAISSVRSSVVEIEAKPATLQPAKTQEVVLSLQPSEIKREGIRKEFIEIQISEFPNEPYRVEVIIIPIR